MNVNQNSLCILIVFLLSVLSAVDSVSTQTNPDTINIDIDDEILTKYDNISMMCMLFLNVHAEQLKHCIGEVTENIIDPMNILLGKINNVTNLELRQELSDRFEFVLCCAFHFASECAIIDEVEVINKLELFYLRWWNNFIIGEILRINFKNVIS